MIERKRRPARILLLAALLLALILPTALADGMSMYFHTDSVIFAQPDTSSAYLPVPKGLSVTLTAMNGAWAQVQRAGITAYCPLATLSLKNRLHGYVSSESYLYLEASTRSTRSPAKLSVNTDIYVLGIDGSFFRVENKDGSIVGYIPMSNVSNTKVKVYSPTPSLNDIVKAMKESVIVMDWYDGGSSVLKKGEYGMLYDIESGTVISIKRMGGSSHADIEPATKDDTAKLLQMCGDKFSWDSRSVILIANGKCVAAAINTMPHGDQTITDNGYDGQFCLHLYNSRTHGSDSINSEHQKAIYNAYYWAH